MAQIPIAASQTDADSPIDQTLMDAIRNNLDDHEGRISAAFAFGQSAIVDDFMGAPGTTGLTSALWSVSFNGAGNDPDVLNDATDMHHMRLHLATTGAGTYSLSVGAPSKMQILFSEEYVAVMQMRVKRGVGINDDSYFFGWNDAGLAATATSITDVSDMIGFYRDAATGNWTFSNSNGGAANTSTNIGTGTSWGVFRITVTCSATAGSRKIDVEHGATEAALAAISGSPFTTNLTTQRLRAAFGVAYLGNAANLRVDYVRAYTSGIPLAA
jgi:hypothetical protein